MYSTKETQAGRQGSEKLVQTSLMRISTKARKLKRYRFRNLYTLLNEIFLLVAWKKINKKAAAGVDKQTANEFKNNLREKIKEIVTGNTSNGQRGSR
jgi:RNA-directed DNA polymerase